MKSHPYPIIAGPTASGKTALSVQFAHALNGEVVSADSMQIYDTIMIGTARPSRDEMDGVVHHLQGFLPLSEKYSVAQYLEDATTVFWDIFSREKTPVMCGGTGLYIQSFMENIRFFEQANDPATRGKLRAEAAEYGNKALWERLLKVDPLAAEKIHENDLNRIVRALEVYMTTGKTITEQTAYSHQEPSPFSPCLFVLDFHDRNKLYDRINDRVDHMMRSGLLKEAETVLSHSPDATVLQAIGYKELIPYFSGFISLSDAVEQLKTSTRHYAKRQLSWFRRIPQARFIYVDEYDNDLTEIVNAVTSDYYQFCEE